MAPVISSTSPGAVKAGATTALDLIGTGIVGATATVNGASAAVTTFGGTVNNKALTSNVATLSTAAAHNLAVGDIVTVSGVDATFNGSGYTVLSVPTATSFTFALTAANVSSQSGTGTVVSTSRIRISVSPAVGLYGTQLTIVETNGDASGSATRYVTVQSPAITGDMGGNLLPVNSQPAASVGTAGQAIKSVMETTFLVQNPAFNPATEVRGQVPVGYSVATPAAPSTLTNWGAEQNKRNQETELKGEGLGDYVAGGRPTSLAHPTS